MRPAGKTQPGRRRAIADAAWPHGCRTRGEAGKDYDSAGKARGIGGTLAGRHIANAPEPNVDAELNHYQGGKSPITSVLIVILKLEGDMGREAEVSYEQVSEIVAELRRDGKKPTARAVRRAAGDKGSLTTILDHLHRLEESEKVAESVTFRDVPIALRTALFAFANAELDQYRQQVEALVEGAKQTVKEVCDENERLRDRSAATELKTQSLETKCSTLIGRCDQMQSELAKLQDELGKERAAAQLTITRLALADNELKHLDSLKHELVQVKADLINHRDARVEVEKEVAVLRALHAAHADQRIHAQHGRDHQATASPTGQGGKPTGRRGRTPSSSAGETDMSGTPVRTLSESDALSPNCGVDDRQKSLVLLDDGAEALAE